MNRFRIAGRIAAIVLGLVLNSAASLAAAANPLDPRGKVHIPIGIPATLDTLKTFVEPEGPTPSPDGAFTLLDLPADAKPPGGFVVCLPPDIAATTIKGEPLGEGRVEVPPGTTQIKIVF